jgi:hypothetical protein
MVSEIFKLIPIIAAKHKEDKLVEAVEKTVVDKVLKTLKTITAEKRLDIKA